MSERAPQTESELVEFVRAIDVRAPQELHERIEALVGERSAASGESSGAARSIGAGPSWLPRRLGAAATAVAIVLVALVVALTSTGGSTSLSTARAYALTQGTAAMPAPQPVPSATGAGLAARVEDVAFPDWEARYGWRSAGERIGRVGARSVTTVFYEGYGGRRIGYAIVAGTPAPGMSGGVVRRLGGTSYRVISLAGAHIVTWLRDGRLCVIGGPGVGAGALLTLASAS
jgi:hypothetical protein